MREEDLQELEKLNLARPKSACCDPRNIRKADKEAIKLLDQFKRPSAG